MTNTKQVDFREIVQARMDELGWTRYRLAESVSGCNHSTVYRFFTTGSINSVSLGQMFDALGLGVSTSEAA